MVNLSRFMITIFLLYLFTPSSLTQNTHTHTNSNSNSNSNSSPKSSLSYCLETRMGLYNMSSPSEGLLPVLVMNTVISVALLKNTVRSVIFQVVGGVSANSSNFEEEEEEEQNQEIENPESETNLVVIGRRRRRRISVTRFGDSGRWNSENENCCVCLCGFEGKEEVSELMACKHFFHKGCLDKWFDNQHSTCPLCRSML